MKKKLVLIVFVLAAIVVSVYCIPNIIVVDKVTCVSQFGPCREDVVNELSQIENSKLNEAHKSLTGLLDTNILVSSYSFQLKFPNELSVNIVERKPIYALITSNTDQVFLVDKDGYIIAISDSSGLPTLVFNGKLPAVGDKVADQTFFALNILYDMFSVYHLDLGKIEDDSLVFDYQGLKLTFPLEGDREVLMGSLNVILNQLNSDDQGSKIDKEIGIKSIDLRYNNPVIK